MAKWHYYIEAKNRIKENTTSTNNQKNYLINDVVLLKENKKIRYQRKNYERGHSLWFINISFTFLLILFFILYLFNSLPENLVSWKVSAPLTIIITNAFNISGILLPIMLSDIVSNILDSFFVLGKFGNKAYILVFCMLVGLVISALLYVNGAETASTYIFGIIGLLLTWSA